MKGGEILEQDPISAQALVDRYRGPLIGLFAAWGVSWGDSEELAQDVFAESFLSLSRFRGNPENIPEMGSWLRGIARNLFRNHVQKRARERKNEPLPENLADRGLASFPPEPSPVLQAMESLSEKYRSVLYMHYLEETPVRVVASLLGLSEKAVESRLFRARRLLREKLVKS